MSASTVLPFRPNRPIVVVRPIGELWHVALFHVNGRHYPIREFVASQEALIFAHYQARTLDARVIFDGGAAS